MSGLREFIRDLEEKGEFRHLKKKITEGPEVWSIMWRLNETGGPAFQAELDGHDIPIVANLFGTMNRWARACGLPENLSIHEYVERLLKLMDGKQHADPTVVTQGACKEVKFLDGEVDIAKLPIVKWHENDGAPYITMGMLVTEDERLGRNVGLYRMSVIGKDVITVLTNMNQDSGIHVSRARAKGLASIPCAVVIGACPAVYMASVTKVNLKEDELRFASCFQGGKSVEIIRCETNDIHVPADSEIVLEGDLLLNEQVLEGPLAEYSGYFEERMTTLTMKIKCITHKRAPVFVTTTAGHVHSEEEVMRVIQQNATVHSLCRQRVTGFVRAGLPQAGRGYTAVVAINKRVPGWGKHAIQQAYSVPYIALQCNNIIVVDEDIDPLDGDQVLWALSTRVDPERDVIIFPPAGVNPLNPAARYRPQTFDPTKITDVAVCSKMGIDATLKVFGELEGHARPVSRPVKPNPQVYEKICAEWAQYGF